MGEQVLAKPMRSKASNRKRSLKDRWVFGTWLGIATRSNEHLVALRDGKAVIKVRTILRRPMKDRWDVKHVKEIMARPRLPNPKDPDQLGVKSERLSKGVRIDEDGSRLERTKTAIQVPQTRDFLISEKVLDKYGYTEGCDGCDAVVLEHGQRPHSAACRSNIERRIREDGELAYRLDERDQRFSSGKAVEGNN